MPTIGEETYSDDNRPGCSFYRECSCTKQEVNQTFFCQSHHEHLHSHQVRLDRWNLRKMETKMGDPSGFRIPHRDQRGLPEEDALWGPKIQNLTTRFFNVFSKASTVRKIKDCPQSSLVLLLNDVSRCNSFDQEWSPFELDPWDTQGVGTWRLGRCCFASWHGWMWRCVMFTCFYGPVLQCLAMSYSVLNRASTVWHCMTCLCVMITTE